MIVVATGNQGKIKEFKRILPSFEFTTMKEVGYNKDIEENGQTFEENALIKARTVCIATGKTAIADDSGLTVDALDGAPGIYSARYAGEGATDTMLMDKLLAELSDVPKEQRTAAFVCVIAYVTPEGEERTFRGECRGEISFAPKGNNGFGYDPVFLYPSTGRTFGEMSAEEKNKISHRAKALTLFGEYMKNL